MNQAEMFAPVAAPAARSARRGAGAAPREMDGDGCPRDKQPVLPGDTFLTLGGRVTTPYPKARRERAASLWLITNATAEAKARSDDFNAQVFEGTTPLRNGSLTDADRTSMLMYLFEWQPVVPARLLRR